LIRRLALPVALGVVLAAVVGAAAFAALQTLPRPAGTVAFGDRLAESISSIPAMRSVERVHGRYVVKTVCNRLAGRTYLLTIPPGRLFVVDGSTLAPLEARWHRGQPLAVEVALSGCPPLLTSLLERIILPAFAGAASLPVHAVTLGRRPVYYVSLTSSLELVLDRRTVTPIALDLFVRGVRSDSILTMSPAKKRAT
jgi:hypothetical protein